MFPKFLFRRVDSFEQCPEWNPSNWKEFFQLLRQPYNNTTEQWNENCREELKEKLKSTVGEFIQVQEQYMKTHNEKLKWNYGEFEMEYHYLENKCKVWKYYLGRLLNETDGIGPFFNENVTEPQKFWEKLIHSFLSTDDPRDQQLILKVGNLLYREHHQILGKLSILPYFVKILDDVGSTHIHVLLLEIIYTSIKVGEKEKDKEIVNKNLKLIIKSCGIGKLFNMLCSVFKKRENININRAESESSSPERGDRIIRDERESSGKMFPSSPTSTVLIGGKHKLSASSFRQKGDNTKIAGNVILILDIMLKITDKQYVVYIVYIYIYINYIYI